MSGKFDMSDYVPVQERVDAFIKAYPEGSLQSEIVELTNSRVTVKAYAYRNQNDPRPGVGHSSLEIPGSTPYTRGSEIENAETSAWGRAIAALGFEVKRGIASAEEVRNKTAHPSTPPPPADPRQRLAEAAVAHGLTRTQLDGYADQVGVPKGERATPAQIEQIIALIEKPEVGLPTPPAMPQESTPSGDQGSGQSTPPAATSVQPAGDNPPVSGPAAPSDDELLAAAGPGAELVPDKPDYVKRAEARAASAKASPKGARETHEAEEVTAGL